MKIIKLLLRSLDINLITPSENIIINIPIIKVANFNLE